MIEGCSTEPEDTIATTFQKRARETKREERAKEKTARREERKQEKVPPQRAPDGLDPDLSGIVPGPQPIPDDDRG